MERRVRAPLEARYAGARRAHNCTHAVSSSRRTHNRRPTTTTMAKTITLLNGTHMPTVGLGCVGTAARASWGARSEFAPYLAVPGGAARP
jgi:hypothetical protein